MTRQEKVASSYKILLQDFGYRFDGRNLICKAIRGFTSEKNMGRFDSISLAAEYLCPIVGEREYTDRLIAIGK